MSSTVRIEIKDGLFLYLYEQCTDTIDGCPECGGTGKHGRSEGYDPGEWGEKGKDIGTGYVQCLECKHVLESAFWPLKEEWVAEIQDKYWNRLASATGATKEVAVRKAAERYERSCE